MAKNDKLKEKIAEIRHDEIILIMMVTLVFAGIALAITFVAWPYNTSGSAGWSKVTFVLILGSLIVFWVVMLAVFHFICKGKRKKLIKELGNDGKKPETANSTKEPTNRDIMNELKEAEGKSRVMMWITFSAVGGSIIVASLPPQTWWTALGALVLIIGGIGAGKRWSPW